MASSLSYVLVVLVSLGCALVHSGATSAICGPMAGNRNCENADCCSTEGQCGPNYCGVGICQTSPSGGYNGRRQPIKCMPNRFVKTLSTSAGTSSTVAEMVSKQVYDRMFPNRNSFYTYEAFLAAAGAFPEFVNSGDLAVRKREMAAFAAHVHQETSGLAVVGKDDESDQVFCDQSTVALYPCAPTQKYYGRGPLLVSWNYNYGAAGQSIGANLLETPSLVAKDPIISFKTAIWVWMTAAGDKPSAHSVMVGDWVPSTLDIAANRLPGFGTTINVLNGDLGCGTSTSDGESRVQLYKMLAILLGVNPGENVDCAAVPPV